MSLKQLIEDAFEHRADFSPANAPADVRNAVAEALAELDDPRAVLMTRAFAQEARTGNLPYALIIAAAQAM